MTRRFVCAISAAAMFATPVLAQDVIGKATMIQGRAFQAPAGGGSAPLAIGGALIRNASIATERKSAAELAFVDDSLASMGEASEMVLDEFVYAGPSANSRQKLEFRRGAFRYTSGRTPKENVVLHTPAATIGIRGTVLVIGVAADGSAGVYVEDGEAVVCPRPPNEDGIRSLDGCQVARRGQRVLASAKGDIGAPKDRRLRTGDPYIDGLRPGGSLNDQYGPNSRGPSRTDPGEGTGGDGGSSQR